MKSSDTWLRLAAVHLSRAASLCLSKPKRKYEMYLTLSKGMQHRCGSLALLLKDLVCQCPGALRNLTLPPPTLSSWCGPCALTDITADTRQRERVGPILLINIFVLGPVLSKLIRAGSLQVCGAQSAKCPPEKKTDLWTGQLSVAACKWISPTVNQWCAPRLNWSKLAKLGCLPKPHWFEMH